MSGHPTAASEARPPVRRLRSWLAMALVLAICVAYMLVWSWWVGRNTVITHQQQAPGTAAEWSGATFRVTALEVVDAVDATGDEPREAVEGAAWVEATVEVRVDRAGGFGDVRGLCELDLLGPDGMTWSPVLRYDDRPERCNDETPGTFVVLVFSYEVPESVLPRIHGLVVPSNSAVRQVIRP